MACYYPNTFLGFSNFNIGSETIQEKEKDFPEETEEMGTVKLAAICPHIRCPHKFPLSHRLPKLGLAGLTLAGGFTSHELLGKVFSLAL